MDFFSKKPKKQRNAVRALGLHERKQVCSCHLSKELKKELGKRAIAVKVGDKAKVMRGSNKGKEGKVTKVDKKRGFVFIEKISRKKANGTEKQLPIRASNVLLVDLERADAKRFKEGNETKTGEKKRKQEKDGSKTKKAEAGDIWAEEKENKNAKKVK